MSESRKLSIGDHVVYTDPVGKQRQGLVTAVWDSYGTPPGCNVVIVHDDDARTDSYGRQIDRCTSVVHRSNQPAHGNHWCWLDEV